MGVATVTDTGSIEGAVTIMDGTGDVAIIMEGTRARSLQALAPPHRSLMEFSLHPLSSPIARAMS